MGRFLIFLLALAGCTDWRDTQNPSQFVLAYTNLAPFPENAQQRAFENLDPDLFGEGCKRVVTRQEAFAFNALLQIGSPGPQTETSLGNIDAGTLTLADAYTVAVKAPNDTFAAIMSPTMTRDFDGKLYEIQPSDYFRIVFAAIEILAAKGCGSSYEEQVVRGLQIPERIRNN